MLASILNLFSGGVLGVAGGIFQKWIEQKHAVAEAEMNLKILMEKNKHEANMADKERQYLIEEAKNALVLAQVNASKEENIASLDALKTSMESDKFQAPDSVQIRYAGAYATLDFLRGTVRIVLTYVLYFTVLIVFAICLYQLSIADIKASFPQTFKDITKTVLFLAELATGYWFAARPMFRKDKD